LASLTDPELVGFAIGHAVGARRAGNSSWADTLAEQIGCQRLLIVLDNFEHLLPAAPLLSDLLGRCPCLHLLVTSRASLRIRCEHEFQVQPLQVPDSADATPESLAGVPSVALFANYARARSPGFHLTAANAHAVAQLCQRLDGLPLALELTAAWIRLLPPSLLLERLQECLEGEMDGPQDLAEHQRTLRATLQWSCSLLSDSQQALFRRLSVFAGGAPIEAIEAVCQAAGPIERGVLRSLSGLVDKSVARREGEDDDLRVSLLEVMRAFAHEGMVGCDEAETTLRAHADWYVALADVAEQSLRGRGQLGWVDRLERERDNLRAALRWARDSGDVELGLALAGRLWRFWERRGGVREGISWLEDLLSRDADVALETRARALNAAGNLYRWIDYPARAARYAESLALYRRLGDKDGIGRLLNNLGMVAQDRHDHRAAVALFEESLTIFRTLADDYLVALCLSNFAISAMELQDLGRAERMLEEANAIRRRLEDALGLARSLMDEGMVLARAGDRERASVLMEESVDLCRALGDQATLAYVLAQRGDVARLMGQDEEAAADHAAALMVAQRTGALRVVVTCIEGLAALAAARRASEVAGQLYGAADAIRDQCGMPHAPADETRRATVGEMLLDTGVRRAWSAGGRLSLAEAVELALAWYRNDHPGEVVPSARLRWPAAASEWG
jgi:predicted ATPase